MRKSKKYRRLLKAAKRGCPAAMYRVGIQCELAANMADACSWIADAAALAYPPAMEWLCDYAFDDSAEIQAHG